MSNVDMGHTELFKLLEVSYSDADSTLYIDGKHLKITTADLDRADGRKGDIVTNTTTGDLVIYNGSNWLPLY